ncbi:DNA-binding response regulator [Aureimonas sp. SA4125]|uniref:response regulator FixJ n=1 Tax=Aureimonas sp. SA4125 TaxID=2826993 RepID=UPI001CC4FB34|nr:response regulator FixJ [Aureimonas sp. SA4125]BDA85684.1 DNA-binding response regulator [Aureimonas sp. SA4125]
MLNETMVHVVDDDLAVRDSLAFMLASDGLPVCLYESASSFLDTVTQASGCIVTDVRMPGVDGIEFLRQLKRRGMNVPVIVMTGHADVPLAVEAMKEGAVDFIEKPFDDELFLTAVRTALDRQARGVAADAVILEIRQRIASLSQREHQVMDGIVAGKANKIVAYELGISSRTVEIYRANVMTKMKAGSLSALVRMSLLAAGL